ncbi:MAG: disulfide bond formation protein B [Gammaproteobacteria bacterium]|nr:disulfide bond formation protein B [Gammaproteobacteria bacterium]
MSRRPDEDYILIAQRWYWLGLLACVGLIAVAYFYFQQSLGLAPCPLCMFQRACLAIIGAFCFLGIILKPKKMGSKLLAFGVMVFSAIGAAIAGRQVWLQHLPADQVPECGPDLAFMMEAYPFSKIITQVLQGSGECAEVQWQFLGVSMPEWMVLIFVVMVVIALRLLVAKERSYFTGQYGR